MDDLYLKKYNIQSLKKFNLDSQSKKFFKLRSSNWLAACDVFDEILGSYPSIPPVVSYERFLPPSKVKSHDSFLKTMVVYHITYNCKSEFRFSYLSKYDIKLLKQIVFNKGNLTRDPFDFFQMYPCELFKVLYLKNHLNPNDTINSNCFFGLSREDFLKDNKIVDISLRASTVHSDLIKRYIDNTLNYRSIFVESILLNTIKIAGSEIFNIKPSNLVLMEQYYNYNPNSVQAHSLRVAEMLGIIYLSEKIYSNITIPF